VRPVTLTLTLTLTLNLNLNPKPNCEARAAGVYDCDHDWIELVYEILTILGILVLLVCGCSIFAYYMLGCLDPDKVRVRVRVRVRARVRVDIRLLYAEMSRP